MKGTTPHAEVLRLIRFAAILWIGYLVVLVIISQSFGGPQRTNLFYYVFLGYIALLCLGLTYWPWLLERLKQWFIPVIVAIITACPILINFVLGHLYPLGPRFTTPESSVLAMFPFLFVGILLVAWQYKGQYVLYVILAFTALNLGTTWSFSPPGQAPFIGGVVITLIQTVIFLAVAVSTSYLMGRMRTQQQSLEEANVRLSHYASTLEQLTTSRERNRLARELHDTLAHTLSGLSVQLETVKAYWDVEPATARAKLEESLAAAHTGLEETRRALRALRASPLEDLGLALAISNMASDAATPAGLALELAVAEDIPPLAPDVEQAVYRVAQEAVTNVVKHAGARGLTVRLEYIEGKMALTVSDDGVGFKPDKNGKTSHFGLAGMEERAQLIGGELTVTSEPDAGTTIKLTVQAAV